MKKPYLFLLPLFFLAVLLSSCGFFGSKGSSDSSSSSSDESVSSVAEDLSGSGSEAVSDESSSSDTQTYTNNQFKFSVDYPSSLKAVEYQDASGVAFYTGADATNPNINAMAAIVIPVDQSSGSLVLSADNGEGRLFSDFVKTAGMAYLPNIVAADSVTPLENANGMTCYKTTWQETPMPGPNGELAPAVSQPVDWCYYDESHVLMFVLNDASMESEFDAIVQSAQEQ